MKKFVLTARLVSGAAGWTRRHAVVLGAVVALALLSACTSVPQKLSDPGPLSLWRDDALAKQALITYVEAVTQPDGPDFIPERERVAVFDFDGTLFCETDPNYFDYCLLVHRVLHDPDYTPKASAFEREVAHKIEEQNTHGTSFPNLETDHGKAVASSFKGMTLAEFDAYVQAFKQEEMPSYEGMKRGEGFYWPMLEVVDYLLQHGFSVHVVSGTDRLIVRALLHDSPLDLPPSQIIGSDETMVAAGQGDTDGLGFLFTPGDRVVTGGQFVVKNLKMNKVSVIVREIGLQPVLAFGNSTGDASMANYTLSDNPHRALAFMLCCDDLERENGNVEKARKMADLCATYGWIPISMKDDWRTIYNPLVIKK